MKWSILILMVLLLLPVPVLAQGPTPQPTPTQRLYSRASLLAGISGHPFVVSDLPDGLMMKNYVQPMALEAGSGWMTIIDLYTSSGALGIIMMFVMLVLLFTLIRNIIFHVKGKDVPQGMVTERQHNYSTRSRR